ncbi:DHX38 [Cordylochernes scorpioides]|uniref:DHX38 n=1 Tax=Cordylochernes scorpioides TaxID=51811 RepID=A0ABY6KC73_9ARAC|nr:DHX38 [Cordylochernes scorpioides]
MKSDRVLPLEVTLALTMTDFEKFASYDVFWMPGFPEADADNPDIPWNPQEWEEEQKRVDREWYAMEDEGCFDEEHNPFATMSEYTRNKEQALESKKKRMSATATPAPQGQ